MKRPLIFTVLTCLVALIVTLLAGSAFLFPFTATEIRPVTAVPPTPPTQVPPPTPVPAGESTSIRDLKRGNPTPGNYRLEGYVVKKYICPPCPARAVCSPCIGDYIIISERKDANGEFPLSDMEAVVFTDKPNIPIPNERYQFNVRMGTDRFFRDEPINNLELLSLTIAN